jgi:hypothetical protein
MEAALTPEQRKELQELFQSLDEDNSGKPRSTARRLSLFRSFFIFVRRDRLKGTGVGNEATWVETNSERSS